MLHLLSRCSGFNWKSSLYGIKCITILSVHLIFSFSRQGLQRFKVPQKVLSFYDFWCRICCYQVHMVHEWISNSLKMVCFAVIYFRHLLHYTPVYISSNFPTNLMHMQYQLAFLVTFNSRFDLFANHHIPLSKIMVP